MKFKIESHAKSPELRELKAYGEAIRDKRDPIKAVEAVKREIEEENEKLRRGFLLEEQSKEAIESAGNFITKHLKKNPDERGLEG